MINAAFANAPLYNGKRTGLISFRGEIWHGMDPDRSGFLVELLQGEVNFERWTNFVLDVPLLFLDVDGVLHPAPGITFRDWMERGWECRYPTRDDWEIHISTVFTEVRLKRYLEIRGADATPAPLTIAVPAVWKGLLYDRQALAAAAELARAFPAAEIGPLSRAVSQSGLRAEYRGRTIAGWCAEAVSLANAGLKRLALVSGRADESVYLDPLREVVESGHSPGDLWPKEGSTAELLARCEYPTAG
jgi:glutamate--cysteine ligase